MTEGRIDSETERELVELLSAAEHNRWAHWQRYLHSKCGKRADGSLIIPDDLVRRWEAQMNTSYGDLSEAEKDSDREQVRKVLGLIKQVLVKDRDR